jgi:hypothetical protein
METYSNSRRVRPLILAVTSAIPYVGGIVQGADAAIFTQVEREKSDRLENLIEALETVLEDFGGIIPIERSDPVIHAAYITIEATLRTARRRKIRAFGKLLASGLRPDPKINLEYEYEDYLKILDDLSIRELQLLAILSSFEQESAGTEHMNDLARADSFWESFERQAIQELSIPSPRDELTGLITRLGRTGMYEPIIGTYFDYEGGRGKLTGAYRRLESILRETPDSFDTGQII